MTSHIAHPGGCRKPIIAAAICFLIAILVASCAGVRIAPEARSAFDDGLGFFSQGRFEEAASAFQAATTVQPDYYHAQLYLGRSYLNLRQYGKAVGPLKKALRLSTDDFKKEVADLLLDALMGAARTELKEGHLDIALNYVREVLSAHPESRKVREDVSRVLVAVAMELLKSGKTREAIREYGDAIKANPDNASAYIGLAKALLRSGDLARAFEAAEKAVSLDPNSKEALRIIRDFLK